MPVLAGVGAGVAVLGSALKAAVEDEAEQKTLATTLIAVAGATTQQIAATEKWIDVTQRATGVADSELRPALDVLVRSTGDVTKAQELLKIAMDVSQGTGKDLSTVSMALAKVMEGNTTAAARLVPELAGIAREGASADEMMAALATTFAGQTNVHAETAAGKMARLNIAFDEMKEKLGEKLMPIFIKFTDWLIEDAIPWIERTATELQVWWDKQDGLQSALKKTGETLHALLEDIRAFVEGIKAAVEWVDKLAKKLSNLPGGFTPLSEADVGQLRAKGFSDKEIKEMLGDKIGPIGSFGSGGVVQGPIGSPQLIQAHGGETILPTHKTGGGMQAISLNIDGRAFMTWLVDYSRDAGGIPITTRAPS